MRKYVAPFPAVLLLAGPLATPAPTSAGTQENAKVALHARPATKLIQACTQSDPVTEGIPCQQFTVNQVPLDTGQFVYLVVGNGNELAGIGGVSCGIRYDAPVVMRTWQLCADLEVTRNGWPDSGGGNRIWWNVGGNCQRTVLSGSAHAVAGVMYLYAYASGIMEVTPNFGPPPAAEFTVADCAGNVSDVWYRGGSLGFGTAFGLNPCWIVDGGCEFMGTGSRHCCCKPESAENLYFRSSREQFCEHEGGSILTGPCESTCEEICTKLGAVPVTWGRLKARY